MFLGGLGIGTLVLARSEAIRELREKVGVVRFFLSLVNRSRRNVCLMIACALARKATMVSGLELRKQQYNIASGLPIVFLFSW